MTPEDDDYLAEDAEARSASRSLLAAGWLRALLVLGALAVVIVISVPYILQWLETGSAERPAMTDAQLAGSVPTPPARIETAPAPAPAPVVAAPSPPAPSVATAPAPVARELPAVKEPGAPKETGAAKDTTAAKEPAKKEPAKAVASAPRAEPPAKTAASSMAKDAPVAKAAPVAKDAAASRPPAKAPMVTAKAAAPAPAAPAKPLNGGGNYWVQVGLFENGGNAERLAQDLRADRFSVEVAQVTRGGSPPAVSRHEVLVTGSSVDAVTAALKGSGTAQAVTGGVVVRPALDLKDAVTLSRRLAAEGLEVRIRRVATAPASGGGTTIHLVRVGGYATPTEAQAGKKALAAKGIAGFVTQGAPK